MRELLIDGRRISDTDPCYVIAEIGSNHGGRSEVAIKMVQEAARCGVSAVKFQKRHNETLYTAALRASPYAHEHSYGKTYGTHRDVLELGWDTYQRCFSAAHVAQIHAFGTAFDEPSVDFLAAAGVPAFKIHSGGLTDRELVTHTASYGRPVLLSTGGGDLADIDRAVSWLKDCPHALLHCTAAYPLKPAEANLRVIHTLRERYPETVIGFSSHSPGIALSLVAFALGARIVEHHFTLDRAGKGTDHAFSLEPKGLSTLVDDLAKVQAALGTGIKIVYDSEYGPLSKMRRWWIGGKWQIGTAQEREAAIHA